MKRIGIIGGGPAGLFMYKRLVESKEQTLSITVFEKNKRVGPGMPYSSDGARPEHITNVSDNEIPEIVEHVAEWVEHAEGKLLKTYGIKPEAFNEYKVLPRLLFGEYLAAQFGLLLQDAKRAGLNSNILTEVTITDIETDKDQNEVVVTAHDGSTYVFDTVIICTGHVWPKEFEGKVLGWFDSPYPPSKLAYRTNYPVAIKGASLTALDVVRTLARQNGSFSTGVEGKVSFTLDDESADFRLVIHSIDGLLPATRFHLEDTQLSHGLALQPEEIHQVMAENDGFIPLDYIFERNFRQPMAKAHPQFFETIKGLSLEEFVAHVMSLRNNLDAFQLFKAEYAEAEKSIRRKQSVYWKEMLASLSYAMNYPAKHLSAEDMLRLRKTLMPLISIIIAFVPQSSCRELIALYDAGVLSLEPVDRDSSVTPGKDGGAVYHIKDEEGSEKQVYYRQYIDATGQSPVTFDKFPFPGLKSNGVVSEAFLRFRDSGQGLHCFSSGDKFVQKASEDVYYMQVPGVNINDHFQVLDKYGVFNPNVYIMAVPLIAGLNPDYSGLDFCENASARIADAILQENFQFIRR